MNIKYSDQISLWLKETGYTHFFYVGGGNVMHLVESLSRYLHGIPVIHEVAAGIAAEYFNATSKKNKALALVTAGPGLTNIVTAAAGAYLESRELLILGGQAKVEDMSNSGLRQRGIQEIDGVSIMKPITKKSILMDKVWTKEYFSGVIHNVSDDRPGPVFIEIPIDIQARKVSVDSSEINFSDKRLKINNKELAKIQKLLSKSKRPLILIGGGVTRETAHKLADTLKSFGVPVATTWNGIDRIDSKHTCYVGRPNTWGQRSANIIIQQTDLLIVFGSRLGFQQTGFNWKSFCPVGKVIQIDLDEQELNKGHPMIELGLAVEANNALEKFLSLKPPECSEWSNFCKDIRKKIPLFEEGINKEFHGYVSPHKLIKIISNIANSDDVIVPCSSGGANTLMMQMFEQKKGQYVLNDKGLASMGYGLSGAIGASIANPNKRVILVEGDGGFAQNIQELGTLAINKCNIKIFIFDDGGYSSIRMTQRSYFDGRYVGCDTQTGLGLPNWDKLFSSWGLRSLAITPKELEKMEFLDTINDKEPIAYIVKIAPEQTYFPKITSRIKKDGSMESNPLHKMTPELDRETNAIVLRYLDE